MNGILRNSEVKWFAYETACRAPLRDSNEAYHQFITPWVKARGGAEIGTWPAWQDGWAQGVVAYKTQLHGAHK